MRTAAASARRADDAPPAKPPASPRANQNAAQLKADSALGADLLRLRKRIRKLAARGKPKPETPAAEEPVVANRNESRSSSSNLSIRSCDMAAFDAELKPKPPRRPDILRMIREREEEDREKPRPATVHAVGGATVHAGGATAANALIEELKKVRLFREKIAKKGTPKKTSDSANAVKLVSSKTKIDRPSVLKKHATNKKKHSKKDKVLFTETPEIIGNADDDDHRTKSKTPAKPSASKQKKPKKKPTTSRTSDAETTAEQPPTTTTTATTTTTTTTKKKLKSKLTTVEVKKNLTIDIPMAGDSPQHSTRKDDDGDDDDKQRKDKKTDEGAPQSKGDAMAAPDSRETCKKIQRQNTDTLVNFNSEMSATLRESIAHLNDICMRVRSTLDDMEKDQYRYDDDKRRMVQETTDPKKDEDQPEPKKYTVVKPIEREDALDRILTTITMNGDDISAAKPSPRPEQKKRGSSARGKHRAQKKAQEEAPPSPAVPAPAPVPPISAPQMVPPRIPIWERKMPTVINDIQLMVKRQATRSEYKEFMRNLRRSRRTRSGAVIRSRTSSKASLDSVSFASKSQCQQPVKPTNKILKPPTPATPSAVTVTTKPQPQPQQPQQPQQQPQPQQQHPQRASASCSKCRSSDRCTCGVVVENNVVGPGTASSASNWIRTRSALTRRGMQAYDILDEITLKDVEPLQSEYPRKDHIVDEETATRVEDTLLYRLLYHESPRVLETLLRSDCDVSVGSANSLQNHRPLFASRRERDTHKWDFERPNLVSRAYQMYEKLELGSDQPKSNTNTANNNGNTNDNLKPNGDADQSQPPVPTSPDPANKENALPATPPLPVLPQLPNPPLPPSNGPQKTAREILEQLRSARVNQPNNRKEFTLDSFLRKLPSLENNPKKPNHAFKSAASGSKKYCTIDLGRFDTTEKKKKKKKVKSKKEGSARKTTGSSAGSGGGGSGGGYLGRPLPGMNLKNVLTVMTVSVGNETNRGSERPEISEGNKEKIASMSRRDVIRTLTPYIFFEVPTQVVTAYPVFTRPPQSPADPYKNPTRQLQQKITNAQRERSRTRKVITCRDHGDANATLKRFRDRCEQMETAIRGPKTSARQVIVNNNNINSGGSGGVKVMPVINRKLSPVQNRGNALSIGDVVFPRKRISQSANMIRRPRSPIKPTMEQAPSEAAIMTRIKLNEVKSLVNENRDYFPRSLDRAIEDIELKIVDVLSNPVCKQHAETFQEIEDEIKSILTTMSASPTAGVGAPPPPPLPKLDEERFKSPQRARSKFLKPKSPTPTSATASESSNERFARESPKKAVSSEREVEVEAPQEIPEKLVEEGASDGDVTKEVSRDRIVSEQNFFKDDNIGELNKPEEYSIAPLTQDIEKAIKGLDALMKLEGSDVSAVHSPDLSTQVSLTKSCAAIPIECKSAVSTFCHQVDRVIEKINAAQNPVEPTNQNPFVTIPTPPEQQRQQEPIEIQEEQKAEVTRDPEPDRRSDRGDDDEYLTPYMRAVKEFRTTSTAERSQSLMDFLEKLNGLSEKDVQMEKKNNNNNNNNDEEDFEPIDVRFLNLDAASDDDEEPRRLTPIRSSRDLDSIESPLTIALSINFDNRTTATPTLPNCDEAQQMDTVSMVDEAVMFREQTDVVSMVDEAVMFREQTDVVSMVDEAVMFREQTDVVSMVDEAVMFREQTDVVSMVDEAVMFREQTDVVSMVDEAVMYRELMDEKVGNSTDGQLNSGNDVECGCDTTIVDNQLATADVQTTPTSEVFNEIEEYIKKINRGPYEDLSLKDVSNKELLSGEEYDDDDDDGDEEDDGMKEEKRKELADRSIGSSNPFETTNNETQVPSETGEDLRFRFVDTATADIQVSAELRDSATNTTTAPPKELCVNSFQASIGTTSEESLGLGLVVPSFLDLPFVADAPAAPRTATVATETTTPRRDVASATEPRDARKEIAGADVREIVSADVVFLKPVERFRRARLGEGDSKGGGGGEVETEEIVRHGTVLTMVYGLIFSIVFLGLNMNYAC